MTTQMSNINYSIKFRERVSENFESRGLKTMVRSGKILAYLLTNVFESACRRNDIRIAKLIADQFPNKYWYSTNTNNHINRYSIMS